MGEKALDRISFLEEQNAELVAALERVTSAYAEGPDNEGEMSASVQAAYVVLDKVKGGSDG